jgi:hypothetical protein
VDPRPISNPATPPHRAKWIWLAAAAPALIAVVQLGRLHPDEVYQVLEPAYWRAYGYGVLAWEWYPNAGIRNWAIPGLFGWLLSLCKAAGIQDPRAYRAVLELPQYLLHVWAMFAAYRYLERRCPPNLALPAFLAVALYGMVLEFGGRTLGESFSTDFLLVAVEAFDRPPGKRWPGVLGGSALGLAVVSRYPSAILVLAALAWLLLRRRWQVFLWAIAAGAVVALALGALDWATWGRPFHSLLAYLDFNVLTGQAAARFGSQPGWFYLPYLAGMLPAWIWPALPFALSKPGDRMGLPLFMSLAYLLALSLTAHKEARFLYPALVLLSAYAAPGLSRLLEILSRRWKPAAALGTSLALAAGLLPLLGLGEIRGDQFRAIVEATRPEDARGLLIVGEGVWGAGGYFYIGKQIPWTVADWPSDPSFRGAVASPAFNRAVTYDRRAEDDLVRNGFRVIDRIGRATVMVR